MKKLDMLIHLYTLQISEKGNMLAFYGIQKIQHFTKCTFIIANILKHVR